jgi:hypothetical protein
MYGDAHAKAACNARSVIIEQISLTLLLGQLGRGVQPRS